MNKQASKTNTKYEYQAMLKYSLWVTFKPQNIRYTVYIK